MNDILRQACVACTLPEDNLGGMTMPDRETVIKGLEILMNGCGYIDCDNCCFYISTKPTRCGLREEQIQEDALALLKEPEAVKPKKVKGYNPPMYTIYEYECEKCKSPMMNKQPFCMGCGRSVIWNA